MHPLTHRQQPVVDEFFKEIKNVKAIAAAILDNSFEDRQGIPDYIYSNAIADLNNIKQLLLFAKSENINIKPDHDHTA